MTRVQPSYGPRLESGNTVERILIADSAARLLPQLESQSQCWARRCTFFLSWTVGELGWGFLLNWWWGGHFCCRCQLGWGCLVVWQWSGKPGHKPSCLCVKDMGSGVTAALSNRIEFVQPQSSLVLLKQELNKRWCNAHPWRVRIQSLSDHSLK